MDVLLKRISAAEERVALLEQSVNDPVKRVRRDLLAKNVYAFNFYTVPSHYYDLTLEQRAELLQCNVPQLCKSIIFENTMCDHNNIDDITDSKYYCVVIQYTSKINTLYLRNLIHELRPVETRISKKKFHFQLASEEDNNRLSGFEHNAIAPFGLLQSIPMIICDRCVACNEPILYLGGGKIDVKLALPVGDLIRATGAIVGHISDAR